MYKNKKNNNLIVVCPYNSRWWFRTMQYYASKIHGTASIYVHIRISKYFCHRLCKQIENKTKVN